MTMLFHIGAEVLHINAGDVTLCGIVLESTHPYALDVLERIDRVKPLCQHCERKAINRMFEKEEEG